MGQIRVGTCAWADHANFYPEGLKPRERLPYYARQFNLVEVDSSYYALQPPRNFALWAQVTPPDFRFHVKAYRALTRHDRTPKPGEENLDEVAHRFRSSLEPLVASGKLTALHFQFPPWFVRRAENLDYLVWVREQFASYLIAIEFRHRSWFATPAVSKETLAFLRDLQFVHTIVDEPQTGSGSIPAVIAVTNPLLAIIRFHGRNRETWYARGLATSGDRFKYLYSEEELRPWAEKAQELAGEAEAVHLLMNNNFGDYAIRNARQMLDLIFGMDGDPGVR
ncbi:MAG: DUF72 domain-containing protein [Limnochordales bacterium]|nr:DUF72 domain-containing protein [Limnochordales bacterium]